MSEDHPPGPADRVLAPFLREVDGAVAETLLGDLVSLHAEPVIQSVLRRKLAVTLSPADGSSRNQDALELAGDVRARMVAELRLLRGDHSERPIGNFQAYVAVTTYNTCHDYLRRLYPRRWQLRNKLRYLLTHRPALALRRGDDRDWWCGLAAWGDRTAPADSARWEELRQTPRAILDPSSASSGPASLPPDQLVSAVLSWLGAPIRLDQLVEVMADLWQVEDVPARSEDEGETRQLADPGRDAAAQLSERRYLERLWLEICALPVRQRAALLLNLRDPQGRGMVSLLPLVGVASIRQIATALERPADQLAQQWRTLPWDDTTIGRDLGIERQQVINLRKAARARLARRMRGW